MYLSFLLIDVGSNPDRPRPGRLWLRNLYHVHQRLAMAFPSRTRKERDPLFLAPFAQADFGADPQPQLHVERAPDQGFLFRIDPLLGNRVMITVQSAIEPDWHYAFQNAGFLLAAPPRVVPYDPSFDCGAVLRFRLVANPTKKVGTIPKSEREKLAPEELRQREGRHGRRVAVPTGELELWLKQRAEPNGFALEQVTVLPGWAWLKKPNAGHEQGVFLRTVRYEGVLRVTDAERFLRAIVRGIGPAKGFGCGLLSISEFKGEAHAQAREPSSHPEGP